MSQPYIYVYLLPLEPPSHLPGFIFNKGRAYKLLVGQNKN